MSCLLGDRVHSQVGTIIRVLLVILECIGVDAASKNVDTVKNIYAPHMFLLENKNGHSGLLLGLETDERMFSKCRRSFFGEQHLFFPT